MRKPVRSTVANRKYFQGGGLAPMKPAAPEEAVGIMASSQPLVDMVAQSAGNPQGGMSPLNFDQGGLFADRPRVRGLLDSLKYVTPQYYTNLAAQGLSKIPATGIGQYFTAKRGDPILEGKVGTIDAIKMYDLIDVIGDRTGKRELVDKIGKDIVAKNPQIKPRDLEEQIMKAITPKTEAEKVMGEKIEQDQVFQPQREGRTTKPIPEKDLKKIEEKGGALAEGLGLLEEDKTKEKTDKDAQKVADEVIPEGTSAADGNIETEEFTFPFGRQSLEKEADIIKQNTNPEAQDTTQSTEDRLGMLMKRFTDAAPKYEGLDSGLALMQMGAIMAGGTSPNAIKNIADALTVTSEKLIKDKSKRDEFNRQLNLSALQYGLGEVSKEDAQKRQDDRNFITLVASKDGTNPLTGEKISKGENIRVSMTDMLSKDIPSMFKDKDMYVAELDAAAKAKTAITDLINERRKELILSDTAAVKQQELYNASSKKYMQSTAGLKFVDNALITLSEGEVTGIKGGVNDLTLKIFSALGLKAGHKFKDKKEFEDSVKKAFQKLIPTALGGVQSANSISNKDVEFLADAYIESSILKGGTFNLVTVNEDILMGKLQTLRDTFVQNQKDGLTGMRQVNDFLSDRTRPGGGSAQTYISEGEKRLRDFKEKEIANISEIKLEFDRKDEDGTKIFKIPGLKSG